LRFFDRPLAMVCAIFLLGSLVGASSIILFPGFRESFEVTLQLRMISPIETAANIGPLALFLLVFLNNSIPPVLSFIWPLAITEIPWTPPLTERRSGLLLRGFACISSFLTGFFGIGAILGLTLVTSGTGAVAILITSARIHGPLELFLVLICIAEPLRLARQPRITGLRGRLRGDLVLLWVALAGLFVSAAIEVFLIL
jgi:hypothetical protein